MNESEEQTIETIKKIADEKRKMIQKVNPELYEIRQQKRLENLAKGRETRRLKLLEKKTNVIIPEIKEEDKQPKKSLKNKKAMVVEDDENDDDEYVEDIETKPIINIKKSLAQQITHNNLQAFNNVYESLNSIKELINNQKDVIIEAVKPKSKTRTKISKPKKIEKTLDLTVNDVEINKIINENNIQPKIVDPKLNAFLEALQKK